MKIAKCTWDAVQDADGYNVYLNGDKVNEELITDTHFYIPGLEPDQYEAYATSVQQGIESDPSNVQVFEISSPPLSTDFGEFEDGDNNQDIAEWISENEDSGTVDLWVVNDEPFGMPLPNEGKAIRDIVANQHQRWLLWDEAGEHNDVQIKSIIGGRFLSTTDGDLAIAARYSSDEENSNTSLVNGYAVGIGDAGGTEDPGSHLSIYKWNDNVLSVIGKVPFEATEEEWINLVLRIEGDSLKAKAWDVGEPEPSSWMLEETDSDHATGRVGIAKTEGINSYVDYFEVESL